MGLKCGASALLLPAPTLLEERSDEAVHAVGGAVVGVQGDVDRILTADDAGEIGEGDRAQRHVLVRLPGGELAPAVADLQDPIRAGLAQALEGSHDRGRGGDVDGRAGRTPRSGRRRASAGTSLVLQWAWLLGGVGAARWRWTELLSAGAHATGPGNGYIRLAVRNPRQ